MSRLFGWIDVEERKKILNETQVEEVIQPSPPTISPSDLATRAREVARSTELKSLPVTENDSLKGMITSRDLLNITSTRSNIPVIGLMTPPIIIAKPEWSLIELSRKIIQADVDPVPVIKSSIDKSLLGIVSLEDIIEKLNETSGDEIKVREIMSEDVITCTPEDKVSKIWNLMGETSYSGVPITQKEKVIGMITRSDIIKSGKSRISIESESGRTIPKVKTLMEAPPRTIKPNEVIDTAFNLMTNHNIGRLPVVENDNIIGIIDREDLIKPYIR